MDIKYLKQVFVYFITTALAVFATFYILYQVIGTDMDEIDTTIAVATQGSKTINTGGYIVREESLLYASGPDAAVLALYKNGERVPINTEVAKVYSGEKEVLRRIVEVDNLISMLEKSSSQGKLSSSDVRNLDLQIQNYLKKITESIQNGSLNISEHTLYSVLLDINSRKVAMKTVSDYNTAISALRAERDLLIGQLQSEEETISTPASGNVFYYLDGYETIFRYADIENLSLPAFREMEKKHKSSTGNSGNAVGKVVTNTYWYFCCEVPVSYVRELKKGNEYKVLFSDNSNMEISMTLDNIITEQGGETALLVLGTRTSPPEFEFSRFQNIRIIYGTSKGYKVPIEAVRVNKGEVGVYILDTHTIKFKKIEILAEIDNHYIVKEQDRLNDEKYYEKLGLFDVIVVSGKDLHPGKFIR